MFAGGAFLASASRDGTIKLWDIEEQTAFTTLGPFEHSVEFVDVQMTGNTIVILASYGPSGFRKNSTIAIWRVELPEGR